LTRERKEDKVNLVPPQRARESYRGNCTKPPRKKSFCVPFATVLAFRNTAVELPCSGPWMRVAFLPDAAAAAAAAAVTPVSGWRQPGTPQSKPPRTAAMTIISAATAAAAAAVEPPGDVVVVCFSSGVKGALAASLVSETRLGALGAPRLNHQAAAATAQTSTLAAEE
jgi:hypothetical protein